MTEADPPSSLKQHDSGASLLITSPTDHGRRPRPVAPATTAAEQLKRAGIITSTPGSSSGAVSRNPRNGSVVLTHEEKV